MSLNGLRIGGQRPSHPPTTSDKIKVGLGCFSIFAGIVFVVGLICVGALR
jgi:hypothetical protein